MVGGLNWLFQKEIRKLDLTSHGTMEALSEFRFSKEVVISKLILLFGNFSKWPFSINGKSGIIHWSSDQREIWLTISFANAWLRIM
jgi:hypothetical protein